MVISEELYKDNINTDTSTPQKYSLVEATEIWLHDLGESIKFHKAARDYVRAYNQVNYLPTVEGVIMVIPKLSYKCLNCGNQCYWTYQKEPDLWRCSKCWPAPKVNKLPAI